MQPVYINKWGLGFREMGDGSWLEGLSEELQSYLGQTGRPAGEIWKNMLLFDTEEERNGALEVLITEEGNIHGYYGHDYADEEHHPLHAEYHSGCDDIFLYCA